jgi:hypothetical protein
MLYQMELNGDDAETALRRYCEIFPYQLEFVAHDGYRWVQSDPYAFGLVLSDFDIHLLAEGSHLDTYEKLGSHPVTIGGGPGDVLRRLGAQRGAGSRWCAISTTGTGGCTRCRCPAPDGH